MTSLFKAQFMLARSPRLLILILLVAMVTLAGCSDQNYEFIQGHWQRGDMHFSDDWYFDRGNFQHEFSITVKGPSVRQSGRYQVLESQDDSLIIELFDLEISSGIDQHQILIVLDWEADTIHFEGKTYQRVFP
jgi:hypothetical protein